MLTRLRAGAFDLALIEPCNTRRRRQPREWLAPPSSSCRISPGRRGAGI